MNTLLRQCHQLDCTVCEQSITHAKRNETAVLDALFGSKEYAICPNCAQQVCSSTFKDHDYRRRVDRWKQHNVDKMRVLAEEFRDKHGHWPWAPPQKCTTVPSAMSELSNATPATPVQ